ncbi:MAG: HPr family phosphocarrier protein [Acidobacteriota bacterium]|jgi:phosphotransferase system HPr (HPr) family protein|nr:HPr family phosphocarrier protein [Acidobacteriota bacterium]
MLESKVKVVNQLGLHARAAAQLVRRASNFKSRITLKRTDNAVVADAKSILSVLTLAASKRTQLELEVDGEDEQEALQAIEEIFANGFGEI